jgi:hypothetical protein
MPATPSSASTPLPAFSHVHCNYTSKLRKNKPFFFRNMGKCLSGHELFKGIYWLRPIINLTSQYRSVRASG